MNRVGARALRLAYFSLWSFSMKPGVSCETISAVTVDAIPSPERFTRAFMSVILHHGNLFGQLGSDSLLKCLVDYEIACAPNPKRASTKRAHVEFRPSVTLVTSSSVPKTSKE